MRLCILVTCGVIALALATGALRSGLAPETLQRHVQQSVAGCMRDAGLAQTDAVSLSLEQAWSPRHATLERCWSAAAHDPRFERLGLKDPVAVLRQSRDRGFAAWSCTERAGYERTRGIPLNAPGGYPLQIAAGHFRVGPTDGELERFYRTAARCSGESIELYRWSDGAFSRGLADGTRCMRHGHNGSGVHAHGCYRAATYPEPLGRD